MKSHRSQERPTKIFELSCSDHHHALIETYNTIVQKLALCTDGI